MPSKSFPNPTSAPVASMLGGKEVQQFHTRILRVSLAVEESRVYWEHLKQEIPKQKRVAIAFEQRWFGSKSMEAGAWVIVGTESSI